MKTERWKRSGERWNKRIVMCDSELRAMVRDGLVIVEWVVYRLLNEEVVESDVAIRADDAKAKAWASRWMNKRVSW